MEDRKQTTVNEVDLADIFQLLWKNKIVILVLSMVCALGFFVKTVYFTDHTYTASGILYVSNRNDDSKSQKDGEVSKVALDAAKALSTTYVEILKTQDFLEGVSADLEEYVSWKDILHMLSVSTVNETELIQISVTSRDPALAYDIANHVVSAAPEKLIGIYETGKVAVVNSVHFPASPNGKGTVKNTTIGSLLGAFLGAFISFLQKFFDTKIRSGADVTRTYGISVLGECTNTALPAGLRRKKKKAAGAEVQNILHTGSSFDTVETYKSIRTNIMFSMPKSERGKVITVTSSAASEGKTSTTINLAITFAQTGARVLLIDCDLRKARVHRYMGIEHGIGVSNVLCGFCEMEEAIQKDIRKNLDVLTAGELPPDPAELLGNAEFEKMIFALQKEYEYIFIDTPPVTVVTDAAVIMPCSDGCVLVTRANHTTFELLYKTVEALGKTNAKILGAIVLDSEEQQKKYGGYRRAKYGYRYGTNGYGDRENAAR